MKARLSLTLVSSLLLAARLHASEGGAAGTSEVPSKFVQVDLSQPSKLSYQGREYRFSAANSYSMLNSKQAADKQFAMLRNMGTNALRMWGFWNGSGDTLQSAPGVYAEHKWQLLDYVIATAGQQNIKLIIPLANYWDEFGGINTLNAWSGFPAEKKSYYDREIFFQDLNSRQMFADYIAHMMNRRNTITGILYKDDPAILMWEPMNEPRGHMDASGQMVADWLEWAAQVIKANDPNHLVGTGSEGFFASYPKFDYYPWQAAHPKPKVKPDGSIEIGMAEGSYFELDCKLPSIDLCSIHAWPFQWGKIASSQPGPFMTHWIDEHIEYMKSDPAYNKPLYLAEFGWQLIRNEGPAFEIRKKVFKAAFFKEVNGQELVRPEVAGVGFWNISDNEYPDPNKLTFDVICPRDQGVCDIIRDFSAKQLQTAP